MRKLLVKRIPTIKIIDFPREEDSWIRQKFTGYRGESNMSLYKWRVTGNYVILFSKFQTIEQFLLCNSIQISNISHSF